MMLSTEVIVHNLCGGNENTPVMDAGRLNRSRGKGRGKPWLRSGFLLPDPFFEHEIANFF